MLWSDLGPAMGSLQERWKSSSIETLAESSFDFAKYCNIFARSSMSMRAAFFVFVLVLTYATSPLQAPTETLWNLNAKNEPRFSHFWFYRSQRFVIWVHKRNVIGLWESEVTTVWVNRGSFYKYLLENNSHHKFLVETSRAALSPIVSLLLLRVGLVPVYQPFNINTYLRYVPTIHY